MTLFPALDRFQLLEPRQEPAEAPPASVSTPSPETPPRGLSVTGKRASNGVSLGSGIGEVLQGWRGPLSTVKHASACRAVDCSKPRIAVGSFCSECRALYVVRYDPKRAPAASKRRRS